MTQSALDEGKRLQSLITDYRRTLEYFERIEEKELKEKLSEFLIGTRMVPGKDQMAKVMLTAAIESCNLCIKQAQEAFEAL